MSDLTERPSDQELAIELRNLSKIYRLYSKPIHRLLDLCGLSTGRHYAEHAALSNVSLDIRRGEKVAIIGRNGAGKSTMLKIIAGVVEPTSGSVAVRGRLSNLLQIGTGFHPDFTGRQNVYSMLAHQGVVGKQANRLFEEILAFAEIEEYIDQPMKTYSTGMCSRLMFSSSVVIEPDVLIVDEILGVGDAYFSHKSFERMRQLCSRNGSTLLLVTHDIYSAMHLCDRFVWIDRGEVRYDGDGKSTITLYEASVKEQEEQQLRQQNTINLIERQPEDALVHVLFRSRTGFALPKPLALESITLIDTQGGEDTLTVADGAAGWYLVSEGNLREPETVFGRRCRQLHTSGSIYHKAEWIVQRQRKNPLETIRVQWRYEGADPIDVRVFTEKRELLLCGELSGAPGWQQGSFGRAPSSEPTLDSPKQRDYGTGVVRITSVEFLGPDGASVTQVRHGDPLVIRIGCLATETVPGGRLSFVIGFARQGSPYAADIYENELPIPFGPEFTIRVEIDAVRLGSGGWMVNLGLGEANMFLRESAKYFTVDHAWYHYLAARLQLQVLSTSQLDAAGCFVVHPARIRATAASAIAEGTQVG
jgi:ABC-type polysaccharide/polyol phosphate transport system ATPase subunit